MVKGKVKTNKANDTKYIYLPKDCGFIDGQEVDIKNSGFGIYQEPALKKYFEENKQMFEDIKKQMKKIRKDVWRNKFFLMGEIIAEHMDYGKLEWDEEIFFEKNNEYSTSPFGDTDGGLLYDFDYRIESIKDTIKENKLTKEQVKKELIDFMFINFLQTQAEKFVEEQDRLEKEMMAKFGFENEEAKGYLSDEMVIYSNGLVQLWYDAESFAYSQMFNITTMHEIKYSEKESTIEF